MDAENTSNRDISSVNMRTDARQETPAKRNAKDSVFCDLFEDTKYLLMLYKALHPEDTEANEDAIGNVSIRNVLLDQQYNDLGFTVGGKLLLLIEAQSTWSVNIIIRMLMYLANTWQEYIEGNKLNIYSSKKVNLPRPEFYVIYTGDRKDFPEWVSLSEEFFPGTDIAFLDAKVRILRDGRKGDIINQYVTFTKVYNGQVKLHGRTRTAVMETIRICKDEDVLSEYLKTREKEVVDIMMVLFDQEYALERYKDELRAESKAEGRAEGEARGEARGEAKGEIKAKRETAFELAGMGLSIDKIAQAVKVNLDTVRSWFAEMPNTAR